MYNQACSVGGGGASRPFSLLYSLSQYFEVILKLSCRHQNFSSSSRSYRSAQELIGLSWEIQYLVTVGPVPERVSKKFKWNIVKAINHYILIN